MDNSIASPGDVEAQRQKLIAQYLKERYEKATCSLCGKGWMDGGTTGKRCILPHPMGAALTGMTGGKLVFPVVCQCGNVMLFAAEALPEHLRASS